MRTTLTLTIKLEGGDEKDHREVVAAVQTLILRGSLHEVIENEAGVFDDTVGVRITSMHLAQCPHAP